jgi:hypothetical protein
MAPAEKNESFSQPFLMSRAWLGKYSAFGIKKMKWRS